MKQSFFTRLSKATRRNLRVIGLLKNWREALAAQRREMSLNELRFRNGVTLKAPRSLHLAFLFYEIWVDEAYRWNEYEIGTNHVVIDIGANIGVFAAYAATHAPGVRVLSFEPFPDCVEWLKANIQNSGLSNVEIYQEALAGRTECRELFVVPSNWLVHSLMDSHGEGRQKVVVNCTTLDSLMTDRQIAACDLLKLDCEGAEYEILRNCSSDSLARIKRIAAEYHEAEHIDGSIDELCALLQQHSFRVDRVQSFGESGGLLYATNLAWT